ncbi:glycosyltransferase family protein [Vibrio ishigakensis]|uniref:hypothetical protein n=1 Tax=Vibrio ishigakensis TaxID=1481914 RepID=UPI0021C2B0AA|nr:hypothetical protein [Vibrio ishigakensis]
MKYSCGITLYHPSLEDIENILALSEDFDHVLVFDNTPNRISNNYTNTIQKKNNITLMSNGINDGLSIAFHSMFERCKKQSDFLCLLDQDSRFDSLSIQKMKTAIQIHNDPKAAIYAPYIQYSHVAKKNIKPGLTDENWVISSGSFIRTSIIRAVNLIDTNYFIDKIDLDIAMTLKILGYKIYTINDIVLYQQLGKTKNFFGLSLVQHSPDRVYYIARNRFYFYKKFDGKVKVSKFKCALGTIKNLVQIIVYHDNKLEKIKLFIQGMNDHRNSKYGKRSL